MIEKFLEKIKTELDIDSVEHHFDQNPKLPYVTWERPQSNNFFADGIVYFASGTVEVLLHTAKRQRGLETKVEKILKSLYIPWEKTVEWDDGENVFIITYTMEEGGKGSVS